MKRMDRSQIIELLEFGKRATDIVEIVGCSLPMVYKVANEIKHDFKQRYVLDGNEETSKQILANGGNYSDITVRGLYKRDGGICYLCGKPCRLDDYITTDQAVVCGDWYPSIDHVVPLAKGGEHSWENVRLAHRKCNSLKSDRYSPMPLETG